MARHAILIKIMQEQKTSKKAKDDSEESVQNKMTLRCCRKQKQTTNTIVEIQKNYKQKQKKRTKIFPRRDN